MSCQVILYVLRAQMTSRRTGIFLEDLSELTSLRAEEVLYPLRRDRREEENPSPVRKMIGEKW